MKILYAAGNRNGSYLQLKRYLPIFNSSKNHKFQIAGYSRSIKDFNANYCLDSLLNFKEIKSDITFNGNFSYYCNEVLKFRPDLIISDLDIFTSVMAIENNIPLWQVSSAILYYGISDKVKRKLEIHKYNSALITAEWTSQKYISNIFKQSERKFVVSHFCDLENAEELKEGFEWCRPEFSLNQLNTEPPNSTGLGIELADLFYNERPARMRIENPNIETITNIALSKKYNLGCMNDENLLLPNIDIKINENVKFLMELLK